jgi:hypothetical protein
VVGKLWPGIGGSTKGGDNGVIEELWPMLSVAISAFSQRFFLLTSLRVSLAKLVWSLGV